MFERGGRGSGLGVRAMERRLACTYLDGDEFLRFSILVSSHPAFQLSSRVCAHLCAQQFSQLSIKGSPGGAPRRV